LTEVIHKVNAKPQDSSLSSHAAPPIKASNLITINTTTEQILKARAAAIAAAHNVSVQLMQQKTGTAPTQSNHNTTATSSAAAAAEAKKREQVGMSYTSNKSGAEAVTRDQAALNAEKEAEQRRLEEQIRQRRAKIDKWRDEKKAKELALLSAQEKQQQLQLQQNQKDKLQLEQQQQLEQQIQNNKV
jgi:hypothetical protein